MWMLVRPCMICLPGHGAPCSCPAAQSGGGLAAAELPADAGPDTVQDSVLVSVHSDAHRHTVRWCQRVSSLGG